MSKASYAAFGRVLQERTGQDIGYYRRERVGTSLSPIMREDGILRFERLASALLRRDCQNLSDRVIDALVNSETYFFRDGLAARGRMAKVLEDLAERRKNEKSIRIWSAGCSTGQEVYSLALAMADAAAFWDGWQIDLLGTDVTPAAIRRAHEAEYSGFEIQRGLPTTTMLRWFEQDGKIWRAKKELRKMVRFQTHDVREGSPDGVFDVILCRNVLIYFPAESTAQALASIAGALASDGVLMVGAGETITDKHDTFKMIPGLGSFYRPKQRPHQREAIVAA